ncbi:hypothetical protein Ocin01_00330 [Orchesella cincta]|uniref:Uncharacterized protein n=1 Tax=Orchesella cincta TaxID=48709 RepID=A0A1D2NM22_ORCCI|nr:hypothetical protein Ocin01_00330 [Orchesella cincta]
MSKVRRGNFGSRNSGGIGAGSSHGVGYGGTTSLGSHQGGGSPVVFDYIASQAISGPHQGVLDGYQAQVNAQASSAQSLDRLQQHGQHSAAAAGASANQAGSWYNAIATGPVPSGYKGERGRK